jgi:chromosomal replication initiator protein
MDVSGLWDRLVESMQEQIGAQDVQIWFRSARPVRLDDAQLVVEVPNKYYAEWIRDNYGTHLAARATARVGRPIEVTFTWTDDDPTLDGPEPLTTAERAPRAIGVNPSQTFENFVVGECNKFSHAAAAAVADFPANRYNPLFIYGSTGLGKTHLMHAIANRVLHLQPGARVIYVTIEDFMNEMINYIRFKRMEDFRAKYRRNADVLLVDDVQFLSGKDRTQEEFFYTFNALQSSGRQIVLTADVPPREIDKLEPRLRTRFEGGLLADMQAPDRETLQAILIQKAENHRLRIPTDVSEQIANAVKGNIRSLEGVVNKLAALRSFYNEPITLAFARRHLPAIFEPTPVPQVTVNGIIEAVARFHNLRAADITGTKKSRTLTRPRHIAMYLARKFSTASFPELGREFGDRDHSTIQHGVRKVEAELETDADLQYKVRLIEQGLGTVRT